jgi:hypothetical protein
MKTDPKKIASLTVQYPHRPRNIFGRVFFGFLERGGPTSKT